jgi:aspartyl-tRNA(Asn)/glutamyl-tRNA(Gln) amidotransferase subunit C
VAITADEVRHIARLANLEFSGPESARFTRQLNAILEYVEQLKRLDTTGIEPTSHVGSGTHALREDTVRGSMPRDQALRNAPDPAEGLFRVPRVLG